MVFSLALKYTKNFHEAQDISQEVFLQVYTQLPTLQDATRFSAWLRQITLNVCHMWHRQRRVSWVSLEAPEHAGLIAYEHTIAHPWSDPLIVYPETALERIEAGELVHEALKTLPEKLQSTISLYYLEGLNYREIAAHLNVPMGTVKRRLHDARQKLKEEISKMTSEYVLLKHAVGLETVGQQHTPIFVKGMHLPAACTLDFSTAIDNQEEITLHILQGDSQKASDCRSIARLQVKGISPAQKRGEPKIKVTFEIEPSGVFQCRARELPNQRLLVEGEPARIDIERSY